MPIPRRGVTPSRVILLGAVLMIITGAGATLAEEPTTTSAAEGSRVKPASDFDPAAYEGKVLLVDFWASWCKPCVKSMPWLAELQARHGGEGLAVVAINIDSDIEKAAAMLAQLPAGVDVYHDKDRMLAEKYKLKGMPSSYLYDRSGRQVASHVGFLPAEADAREQEIVDLLAEGKAE